MHGRGLTRRRLLAILSGAATASLVAACGGSGGLAVPAVSTPAPPAAPRPTATIAGQPAATPPMQAAGEVKVNFRDNDDARRQGDTFIPAFNASHPNLKVTQEILPNQPEYFPKVATLHAAGQLGDVVWASMAGFRNLAIRKITRPIDDLIAADNYDLREYLEIGISDMRWEGKLYGLPWGAHTGSPVLLYNVDLVDKAGLKIPDDVSTYDKLLEAARKLTVRNDHVVEVYGFAPGWAATDVFQWMRAYGGNPWDADGKQVTIKSPESLAGFKAWGDFFLQELSPIQTPNATFEELFAAGRIAMMQSGYRIDFNPGESIGERFRWDATLMPKGPGPNGALPTNFTVNGLTMAAKAKNPDGAWAYIKYLMDKETQIEVVTSGGGRPAPRQAILDDPRLMSLKGHRTMRPTFETAQDWLEPGNLRIAEARNVITQNVAPIAARLFQVTDRIDEIEQQLQAVLDKPRSD
jgi:multiple sugar transport system substrate-binding protein